MASRAHRTLPVWGGGFIFGLLLVAIGCSAEDNSPNMGAVAPKPNPNISAQLPPAVRDQIAKAKIGSDANKMSSLKSHGSNP